MSQSMATKQKDLAVENPGGSANMVNWLIDEEGSLGGGRIRVGTIGFYAFLGLYGLVICAVCSCVVTLLLMRFAG